jgi:hypothetical protein
VTTVVRRVRPGGLARRRSTKAFSRAEKEPVRILRGMGKKRLGDSK